MHQFWKASFILPELTRYNCHLFPKYCVLHIVHMWHIIVTCFLCRQTCCTAPVELIFRLLQNGVPHQSVISLMWSAPHTFGCLPMLPKVKTLGSSASPATWDRNTCLNIAPLQLTMPGCLPTPACNCYLHKLTSSMISQGLVFMPSVHVTYVLVSLYETGESVFVMMQWDRLLLLVKSFTRLWRQKQPKANVVCVSSPVLSVPEH